MDAPLMSRNISASTGGLRGSQDQRMEGQVNTSLTAGGTQGLVGNTRVALHDRCATEARSSPAVDGAARAVEHAAKHVARHRCAQHLRQGTAAGVASISATCLGRPSAPTRPVSEPAGQPATCISPALPAALASPVNSRVVDLLSMPLVPSNTCTTARSPSTSSTWRGERGAGGVHGTQGSGRGAARNRLQMTN